MIALDELVGGKFSFTFGNSRRKPRQTGFLAGTDSRSQQSTSRHYNEIPASRELHFIFGTLYWPEGGVTLVNLQRQLATPIRNACFSHEFADMLHFWIALKNFQRVAALQISQKIVRNGVLHWNDFSRNIVSLQVDVASWPV